jgi:hypothetical protein
MTGRASEKHETNTREISPCRSYPCDVVALTLISMMLPTPTVNRPVGSGFRPKSAIMNACEAAALVKAIQLGLSRGIHRPRNPLFSFSFLPVLVYLL